MEQRPPRAAAIDGSAMTLSGLCLIHCLALPLMSTALPIAGVWAEAEWLHRLFVVAALPFVILALASKRVTWLSGSLIGLGFSLLVAGAFVEALHDFETELTVIGALMLATGHALRWRGIHSSAH